MKMLVLLVLFATLDLTCSQDGPTVYIEPRNGIIDYSTASMCPFDCKPEHCRFISSCPSGLSPQYDGCRCCQTCLRGQGDLCDYQNPCNPTLTCVYVDGTNNRGICRSNKTCRLASGKVLQDGESFQPHCSMQCSCQGGLVGCASLCQNDERNMAFAMRGNCQRVRVQNSCCPQWVCDSSSSVVSAVFFRKGAAESSPPVQASSSNPPSTSPPSSQSPTESRLNNEKVAVERVVPAVDVQPIPPPSGQRARSSKMRSMENVIALRPYHPENCSGTPVVLRSCSLNNKCGLRLTDDFVSRGSCPENLMPSYAYCLMKPCAKKRRQEICDRDTVPMAEFSVKVRHSGCRPERVIVQYCKSCSNHSENRCCLPTSHTLVSYNQTCYDGTVRTFYVAQAAACTCRSDIARMRECYGIYQKMIAATLPPFAQIYEQDDENDDD